MVSEDAKHGSKNKWMAVALVGGDFEKIKHPYIYFTDSIEAKDWLRQQRFKNVSMLVKGSRSMQMEWVIEEDV